MTDTTKEPVIFTSRDWNKFAELVSNIIDKSDFEYQDDDYKFYIVNLYEKLLDFIVVNN